MKYLLYGHRVTVPLLLALWRLNRRCVARLLPQGDEPRQSNGRGRRIVIASLLLVGLVVQVVLVVLLAELVDLCISLMELWADLARKHLEITL